MINAENFKTENQESPKDKRDIQLGKISVKKDLPNEYLPDYPVEITYQNGIGCCGGCAGAYLKAILDGAKNYSFRFVYSACKKLDGIPNPYSEGTFTRAIGKALAKYGACDESLYKSDVSLDHMDFKDFNKVSKEAFFQAQNRIIRSYAFTGTGIEDIKQAIHKHKAVILLITPFFKNYSSGHFVCATGWKNNKIRFVNSFGKNWGKEGYGWYSEGGHQKVLEVMTVINLPKGFVKLLTSQITLAKKAIELLLKLKDLKR